MKKKIYPIVLVKWRDAWHTSGSWKELDQYKKRDDGYPCQTVGFLLHEDKKSIRVGQNLSNPDDTGSNVMTIPHGWYKKKVIGKSEWFVDE